MVKMITDRSFRYGGRKLDAAEEFDCEERDAHTLSAVGYAHKADAQTYRTRALEAAPLTRRAKKALSA